MGLLGNLEFSLGMDGIDPDQELWRFLDLWKTHDLFRTHEMYLRQVALLRTMDSRESRLPTIIRKTLVRANQNNPPFLQFVERMLDAAENQATRVYASCWYLPDPSVDPQSMWRDFAGGDRGGICLITSIRRLGESLLDGNFEIGAIRYIDPEMGFRDAFNLNQYRSFPFLMKLARYRGECELRLFKRHSWTPQPPCLRTKVDLFALVKNLRISPLITKEQSRRLHGLFVDNGVPAGLFLDFPTPEWSAAADQ